MHSKNMINVQPSILYNELTNHAYLLLLYNNNSYAYADLTEFKKQENIIFRMKTGITVNIPKYFCTSFERNPTKINTYEAFCLYSQGGSTFFFYIKCYFNPTLICTQNSNEHLCSLDISLRYFLRISLEALLFLFISFLLKMKGLISEHG